MSNSNKLTNKKMSVKEIFNFNFMLYLLLVSIPASMFFSSVFNQQNLNDIVGLFILIFMITAATIYFILRDGKKSLEDLSNQSVIGFIIFISIATLILILRRMFQENIYTIEGAVFFSLFVLTILIIYNFVKILVGIS